MALATAKACFVVEHVLGTDVWRVIECRPDGTITIVEDGITSRRKAMRARKVHDQNRAGV